MVRQLADRVTGVSFLLAGVMLWGGWALLPHRLGTYFAPGDFAAVGQRLTLWIWMFRLHIFGLVIGVIAVAALAAAVAERPARLLVWPGAAVTASGLMVTALAAAFYYHFGAWGAVELRAASPEVVQGHVTGLRIPTEYVTCLVRFGRVFSGLGLLVLGGGMLRFKLLPGWIGAGAAAIGLAAMAVTMGLPDELHLYLPIFHLLSLWLAATGAVVLARGLRLEG